MRQSTIKHVDAKNIINGIVNLTLITLNAKQSLKDYFKQEKVVITLLDQFVDSKIEEIQKKKGCR